MDRKYLLLSIVFAIGFIVKLVPSLFYGTPFSTDVWPLVNSVEKLVRDPGYRILDDRYFGGYHNHWPGVILFTTIASITTGVEPLVLMPIVVPFINGFAIVFFYLVLVKSGGSDLEKACTVLFLGLLPPLIVFTAAATKEGFTHPLFMLMMYYTLPYIHGLGLSMSSIRRLVLVSITGFSMVLSHHLTTFMYVYIVLVFLWVMLIAYSRLGLVNRISLTPLILVLLAGFIHYKAIGWGTFHVDASVNDIISLVLYTLLIPGVVFIFFNTCEKILLKDLVVISASTAIVVSAIIYSMSGSIAPGIPCLGASVLYYGLPYVFTPASLYLVLRRIIVERSSGFPALFMASWILACASLIAYLVFSNNPLGASAVHRVINFSVYPVSFILGSLVSRTIVSRNNACKVVGVVLASLVLFSGLMVTAMVVTHRDSITFYWIYVPADYYGGLFVSLTMTEEIRVSGDAKIDYLLQYFDLDVVELDVIRLVTSGEAMDNTLYVFYRDNYVRGVVSGLMVFEVHVGEQIICSLLDRVYSSILVDMYFA